MKNLTDLPIELILKIFNYLEYDDLIVLKRLNEEWTSLVGRCIESKTVVINECEFNLFNSFLPSYYSSFYDNSYLIGKSFVLFKLNTDLHHWIKKLILYDQTFIFNLIGFDSLIDLEINLAFEVDQSPGQLSLRIKNLKYLKFSIFLAEDLRICLDTPKLTNLDVNSINQFEIIHPFSIKYLKISNASNEKINQMNNLEELIVNYLDIDEIGDLFNRLKRLKKFNFDSLQNDLNQTHQFIQSILLLKPILKISYRNIELNSDLNLLQLDGLDSTLNDESVPIYMNHLDKISNLTHRSLILHNFDLISTEFIQKLTNLKRLTIDEIKDQEKWIQLLSLPTLTKITIDSFVDQEYLNLIPKYCKFLTHLYIKRFENSEWLLQLKYLEYLKINYQLDFEMFKKLINNLKYLRIFVINLKYIKESYKIEIKHGNVEISVNEKIFQTYSKLLFLRTIESCSFWSDLFPKTKFK